MIHTQSFEWKPKSKARPRMTKTGHTYTEPATVAAEKNIREQYTGPCFEGPVDIDLEFSNTHVNIVIVGGGTDYLNRKLTGDIDNYSKLILDALNLHAYADDKQIVSLLARKL